MCIWLVLNVDIGVELEIIRVERHQYVVVVVEEERNETKKGAGDTT